MGSGQRVGSCAFARSDEDIPTEPPPPYEDPHVAAKDKSNEVRIGPMTRARAKLLEQQVNLFLAQTDVCIDENFILPKSLHVCIIRSEGIASVGDGPIFSVSVGDDDGMVMNTMNLVKITCMNLRISPARSLMPMQQLSTL